MKNRRDVLVVAAVLVALLFAGCGGQVSKKSEPKRATKVEKQASKDREPQKLTAQDVVEVFQEAGIPLDKVVFHTAETDPNKLLGRPNQYTEKANWADTRLEQTGEDPIGGTVELFASDDDLQRRKSYIETISQSAPMLVEYIYAQKNALVRVSKDLTPDQAAEYEKALKSLSD